MVTAPIGEDGQPAFVLDGWDYRFSTSENVFYKCAETDGKMRVSLFDVLELDEYYGDIYSLIIGTLSLES